MYVICSEWAEACKTLVWSSSLETTHKEDKWRSGNEGDVTIFLLLWSCNSKFQGKKETIIIGKERKERQDKWTAVEKYNLFSCYTWKIVVLEFATGWNQKWACAFSEMTVTKYYNFTKI